MRNLLVLITVFLSLCSAALSSQHLQQKGAKKVKLEVSDVKWLYLQFPAKINYVDMGTEDIVAEKIGDAENILRIRSEIPVFDNTTLTAITKDGKIYTFDLNYDQDPKTIAIDVKNVGDSVKQEHYLSESTIELSSIRTSHLSYNSDETVIDVAVGVDSIIAEKISDFNNVVIAKRVGEFDAFTSTSLHVVTKDSKNNVRIYPHIIKANENPELVNLVIGSDANEEKASFSIASMNEVEMEEYGKAVVEKGAVLNNIGISENKMLFSLIGLFIKDDILMFHLYLQNDSKIDYEIDFIRSYIQNKKKTKKQTYQDDEKIPIYVYKSKEGDLVEGDTGYSAVFFFKRFTVPDKHQFYFEIFEKNGGRHLKFTASNKEILNAKKITK
ncbi:MAG: DUF4138 domain-containing protein [Paludibacteraceae bacterium]|nr:DUF4138 domain-containing protein [Paludibacteraceae bacterium]